MELQVNDLFVKIGVLTVENDFLKQRIAELEKQLTETIKSADVTPPQAMKDVTPKQKSD